MRKILHPASLLLYLLATIVFLFLGMSFAAISGASKDQGLAGGAIVFFYGLLGAGIAFIGALFIAGYASIKTVVTCNKVLALILVICLVVFAFRFYSMQKDNTTGLHISQPPVSVSPMLPATKPVHEKIDDESPMGLGFFKPYFFERRVLNLYGNPNIDKPVDDHSPLDSIVFARTEYGSFDISYAPPWLVPDHLKLDYDILYFRIYAVSDDFAEILVNTTNGKTAYVSRGDGEIIYWPDFLLSIHSVEFTDAVEQRVRIKPLSHASEVIAMFDFMKPLVVQDEWMMVDLYDEDFTSVGKGWIQWRRDGRLLISYSLLS